MGKGVRLGALAILAVIGAACSPPGANGAGSPSASHRPSASPSPTALFAFTGASGAVCPDLKSLGVERTLLTSTNPNRPEVVLCDAKDLAHPRLLKALAGAGSLTFLSGDTIGYISETGGSSSTPAGAITSIGRTLDLVTGKSTDVVSIAGRVGTFAWSHDLSMVAYLTDTGGVHHWWLMHGGAAPVELTAAIQFLGRGGNSDDESLMAFSGDDQYLLVVDTTVARLLVYRTSDGKVVYRAPSGGSGGFRTMGIWAHQATKMYFRNNHGVYSWDPAGGISSYLPGVQWTAPAFTVDDRYLAYTVGAQTPHVEIRDVSGGSVISSSPWRANPVFLSASTLLLDEEAACASCAGGAFNWTGRTLVFHSDTRAESDLGITGSVLSDFWPHF